MLDHISEVEYIASQLEDLGEALSPLQIIVKITSTLPPSYRSVVSMWGIIPDSTKTVSMLTSHLLAEETLINMHGVDKPADAAFFARRGFKATPQLPSSSAKQGDPRANLKNQCWYCPKEISERPIEKTRAGGKKPT